MSDAWNIANSFLGWIPGVTQMGNAIDQTVNPGDYEEQKDYSPHGMFSNNIAQHPQSSYYSGYPQNNNGYGGNNSYGGGFGDMGNMLGSFAGNSFGGSQGGGSSNGLGSLMSMLPMFLAGGGSVGHGYDDDDGHEQHYDDGGLVQQYPQMMQDQQQMNNPMNVPRLGQAGYASNGISNQQAPNFVSNGFSGMKPMFSQGQTDPQQQHFARGGVATNFGRARGRL